MMTEDLRNKLSRLYGADAVENQSERYAAAARRFEEEFGENIGELSLGEPRVFRAPGRIEIGGNHTDHQHGQVLAAAIDRDVIAVAAASEDTAVRIYSEGFGWIETDLGAPGDTGGGKADACAPGTAEALVYGVAAEMQKRGYKVGGFRSYATSNVPEGGGLSSSAAFEILIGEILSGLYNGGAVPPEDLAHMAQASENNYYGKPCGLMDQMASAMGGLCRIDFSNPATPVVEKLDVDFSSMGYSICITDTHGSHAEFTDDYAAVQTDLAAAASVCGKDVLEGVSLDDVIARAADIREAGGDRAFLRAMHVAAENARVLEEADALKRGDMPAFLDLVRRSGDSSYKLLQNVHVDRTPERQEVAVALAISEAVLGRDGACRVHGGGFAGTMIAFVPEGKAEKYRAAMNEVFGEGSCFIVRICPEGGMEVDNH